MSLSGALKRLISRNSTASSKHNLSLDAVRRATAPVIERLEERQLLSGGTGHTHLVGTAAPTFPAIVVKGINNAPIAYQDSTYLTADGTDFGSMDTKLNKIETFTIGNTGVGLLNLTAFNRIQVTGANAADFTVTAQPAASVAASGSTTFKLKFQPTIAGLEQAVVTINNDTDGKDPFTFAIQGTGTQVSKAQVVNGTHILAAGDTTVQVSDNTQFGTVESNNGSVTQTYSLKNLGSGPLTLTGTNGAYGVVSGASSSGFTVVTQPAATIAAGASSNFTVRFAPGGTVGAQLGTITFTTNDPNVPSYHFNVGGTGTAQPVMTVVGANSTVLTNNQTAVTTADGSDFGNTDIASGATLHTFTIKNAGGSSLGLTGTPVVSVTGTNATAFTIVTQPANSVAAASNGTPGSLTFTVRFAPGTVGAKGAQIVIANADPALNAPFKFNVSGTGVSQSKISVSGGSTPTVIAGDGTNTAGANGNADNTGFGQVDITGGAVTRTYTLADLGSQQLRLTGNPKVSVAETGGGTDFSVVTQPALSVLGAVTPSNTHVGATPVPAVAVAAAGPTNKSGHHVSHGRTVHAKVGTATPTPTPTPTSTTFAIKFAPTDETVPAKAAVVTITSDDPATPSYTFNIAGTAVNSSIAGVTGGANNVALVNGDTTPTVAKGTDFGSSDTTQTVTQTYTITNTGTDTLNFTGGATLSNTTDFAIPNGQDIPASIAPAGTATFQVAFHPAATGLKTGTVSLTTDDPNAAHYVFSLKGTGVASPVTAVTSSVSDGNGGFNDVAVAAGATTTSAGNNTNFGNAELNAGFVTETYKITNSGSTVLTVAHLVIGGTNHGDFVLVGSAPTTVAANGGTATFQIKFRPTATGIRTGTITLQSNDAVNASYTFAVKGTCVRQPTLALYGLGNAITVNNQTNSLSNLTDYGNVDPAGPVTHTFTIRNLGSDSLDLTSALAITGTNAADFTLVNRPRTAIAPGATASFDLKFTPSTTGPEAGIVTIASDDPTNPSWVLNLTGTGVAAPLETVKGGPSQNVTITSGATTFQTANGTELGQSIINSGSSTNTFTINNTGSAALNLSTITMTGTNGSGFGDFTIVNTPTTPVTAATGTTTFSVKFTPTAAGSRTAVITIPSDDPTNPSYTFTVHGTGTTAPIMAVTSGGQPVVDGSTTTDPSNNTDYGQVEQANGTATQTFTIADTGSAALTLTGATKVAISGTNPLDFTVVTQPGATVAANASETFAIKFAPKGSGTRTATVTIASNDLGTSPYTFTVTGTAVQQPVITLTGAGHTLVNNENATTTDGSDFGTVHNGASKATTYTIKNTGSQTLNLQSPDLVEINGTFAGDFVLTTPPGVTALAPGASTTFVVTFTPSVVGAESAQVTIDSDDPNGTFSFNLAGTGN